VGTPFPHLEQGTNRTCRYAFTRKLHEPLFTGHALDNDFRWTEPISGFAVIGALSGTFFTDTHSKESRIQSLRQQVYP